SLYLYLEDHGVEFHFGVTYQSIDPISRGLRSGFGRAAVLPGTSLSADCVVQATGASLPRDPSWKLLPLHPVKGQSLLVTLKRPLPFSCSVSGLGYIAQKEYQSSEIMLGSTYEHSFDHEEPDEQGADYLLKRLEKILPGLSENLLRKKGWAGTRITTPNRKPVVGRHPDVNHLYIMSGLG